MKSNSTKKVAARILNTFSETTFPVQPDAIAKQLEIKIFNVEMDEDISGALHKEAGKDAVIFVNSDDSDQRKRMTIAHELGHCFLRLITQGNDLEYNFIDFRNSKAYKTPDNVEERFANAFADNLLMPAKVVTSMSKKNNYPVFLKLFFNVSDDAISRRMDQLGITRPTLESV